MLAFPSMIAVEARDAGMKVPEDPDGKWDFQEYLHFGVFCQLTLGRSVDWAHFRNAVAENAKIIASIPIEKLGQMTLHNVEIMLSPL